MMKIGTVLLKNPFVLAPMAGVNCTSFRLLCKRNNAGLIYTQMMDSRIVDSSADAVKKSLNILDEERPVTVQVIGSDPGIRDIVKLVEPYADIIDVNLGCIVPTHFEKGEGAALLGNLDKMRAVVSSAVAATDLPVSAKIRIGIDNQSLSGVRVARILEECGVCAVAVHGRTIEQKYSGKVNWNMIKDIQRALDIPVIANGDVRSYKGGLDMMARTGCGLVMVGREAKHAPWVFNKDFVATNETIKGQIREFISLYKAYEARFSFRELREHVCMMSRDIRTKERKDRLDRMRSVREIERFLEML